MPSQHVRKTLLADLPVLNNTRMSNLSFSESVLWSTWISMCLDPESGHAQDREGVGSRNLNRLQVKD